MFFFETCIWGETEVFAKTWVSTVSRSHPDISMEMIEFDVFSCVFPGCFLALPLVPKNFQENRYGFSCEIMSRLMFV